MANIMLSDLFRGHVVKDMRTEKILEAILANGETIRYEETEPLYTSWAIRVSTVAEKPWQGNLEARYDDSVFLWNYTMVNDIPTGDELLEEYFEGRIDSNTLYNRLRSLC